MNPAFKLLSRRPRHLFIRSAHQQFSTSTSTSSSSGGGSSLLQRLSSFLAGVGTTSLLGYYFLYQDVQRSTELVKSSLSDVTRRIEALEKKS